MTYRALARKVALTYASKVLVDTGKQTFMGGTVWGMKVSADTFIHFTLQDRAGEILKSGKLMMNPPYEKSGIDAVNAVSLIYGEYVPSVQTTHIKGTLVAILFQTSTVPKLGVVEEVIWKRDVVLKNPKVVSVAEAIRMIKSSPMTIRDEDEVRY